MSFLKEKFNKWLDKKTNHYQNTNAQVYQQLNQNQQQTQTNSGYEGYASNSSVGVSLIESKIAELQSTMSQFEVEGVPQGSEQLYQQYRQQLMQLQQEANFLKQSSSVNQPNGYQGQSGNSGYQGEQGIINDIPKGMYRLTKPNGEQHDFNRKAAYGRLFMNYGKGLACAGAEIEAGIRNHQGLATLARIAKDVNWLQTGVDNHKISKAFDHAVCENPPKHILPGFRR